MDQNHDLQPLLDIRQNQLSIIFAESNSIDTKALALIGADIAVLIFIAQAALNIHSPWLGTLLIGSYIVSVVAAIFALWPFAYIGAGVNLAKHPEYLEFDSEGLVLQLISDTEVAIDKDKHLNRTRWRAVLLSFGLAAIGTATLFVIL